MRVLRRDLVSCDPQIIGIVYSARVSAVPDTLLYTRENYFTGAYGTPECIVRLNCARRVRAILGRSDRRRV